ncbi:sulfurtransferase complex subunit TusC [Buchnera aphidicola]|uniref:sulfurtransferase complex subunit TusC n=1 Tax=Buchnera aphidicola TaxID=9 RepID=UPI003463BF5D
MKKIAVVFSCSPHGNSLGKEGLDFVLSASCLTNNLSLFFIEDGIFQILSNQDTRGILLKNYSLSFRALSFFNINSFYLCYDSLLERGCFKDTDFILPVNLLNSKQIRSKLYEFDHILNF